MHKTLMYQDHLLVDFDSIMSLYIKRRTQYLALTNVYKSSIYFSKHKIPIKVDRT